MIEKTLGTADNDAYEFVKVTKDISVQEEGFFVYKTDNKNKCQKCLFISNVLKIYSQHFLDVVLVDSTYKRNRFNLILVNILGVNNYGHNIMLGFGLLSDETVESYMWLFSKIEGWEDKEPDNFVCDESESIIQGIILIYSDNKLLGIENNFQSRIILCGWHIQRNFISKLKSLRNLDKELYQEMISLPFVMRELQFDSILQKFEDSEDVSQEQFEYIEKKLKRKKMWAKCFLKSKFAGGISTTSRVEGLHATLKRGLNSSSSLQTVFVCFRLIEKREATRFTDEFIKQNGQESLSQDQSINALKAIQEKYSNYVYKKICYKFNSALNLLFKKLIQLHGKYNFVNFI